MVTVDQARQIVFDTVRAKQLRLSAERVPLAEAWGRVLAQDLCADVDQPPFNRSIKDGYAVRSADVEAAPVELRVVGESKAGEARLPSVAGGEAVQIMTGAPIPRGADAVVMVEDTEAIEARTATTRADSFDSRRIRIRKRVAAGANIAPRGSEARAGEVIVPRGRRLRVHEISFAASVGASSLEVFRKPRVGILATGDELVAVETAPGQNQIRNSNGFSLQALAQRAQAIPELIGIAKDDVSDLKKKVAVALESGDCVLLTGGVSAGKYDLVEPVLKEFGTEFYFDAVAIRPGKPMVFGTRGHQFIFGLPGNPVSVVVTFQLFVRPLLDLLSGSAAVEPAIVGAQLENTFRQPTGRRGFLPALYELRQGKIFVKTVRWKGSSDLAGLSRANCFLIAPETQSEFQEGSTVQVLLPD